MFSTIAALLGGFILGFGTASGLALAWRGQESRLRRITLGFAARSLVAALTRLQESIETIALDPELLREVTECRDLAAAVARLVEG